MISNVNFCAAKDEKAPPPAKDQKAPPPAKSGRFYSSIADGIIN